MGVKLNNCSYSPVPNRPYDNGSMSGLSLSAQALWHFFYHVAHRVSSFRFVVSERVVKASIGMCANTERKTRAELVAANLIRCESGAVRGAPCIVNLVNPESGELFADANGKPAVYSGPRANKPSAPSSPPAKPASAAARAPVKRLEGLFGIFTNSNDPSPQVPARYAGGAKPIPAVPASVAPRRAVIQEQTWRCSLCRCTVSQPLPDGSKVCAACHTNPDTKPVRSFQAGAPANVTAGAKLATTEDGLPLDFP
jgi:hypothetical protein